MKYIIFDMDGVIVDSEPVIMKAALDALRAGGIKASKEDFIPYIGAGEEHFIIEPCKRADKVESTEKIMNDMFVNFEKNIKEMRVFPSAKPLIEKLKVLGYTLSLVSSAAERKLMASLRAAQVDPSVFSVILSGNDVTEKKPSPAPYLLAAEKLGADPADCLVIEDAVSGVKSAKAAGMQCAAVTTSFSGEQLKAAGADYVTEDIIDILSLLNG